MQDTMSIGALIIAIVHHVRKVLPVKYHDTLLPLLAFALGAGISYITEPTKESAIQGAIIGITASGIVGTAKAVLR